MKTLRIPNGWYCDSTPTGEYVAQVKGGGLVTPRGAVPMPPSVRQLLFLRLAQDGQRFAGVGQQDDLGWLWDGTSWSSNGLAYGPNSVIFRADGTLQVEHTGAVTGSQGWRYVADDGTLVTGDSTYADPARGLWEYTTHGDVTIGQGGSEEGCQALVAGRRVQLESGWCRNIRFNRGPDGACSVAMMKPTESVLLWFTRAEFDAMPPYVRPGPLPPPVPPPSPVPPPIGAAVLEILNVAAPDTLRVGVPARVLFDVRSDARIVSTTVDLIGDGQEGWTLSANDARVSAGVVIRPQKAGRFELRINATSATGQTARTGLTRWVTVLA